MPPLAAGAHPPAIAIPIQNATRGQDQNGLGIGEPGDPMYTLDNGSQHAVAFSPNASGKQTTLGVSEVSPTIKNTTPIGLLGHRGVRRLTPVETERLQGMPDGWIQVPYRGKPMADSCRYKMIGNSFAVPVVRWIGRRIQAVHQAILEMPSRN